MYWAKKRFIQITFHVKIYVIFKECMITISLKYCIYKEQVLNIFIYTGSKVVLKPIFFNYPLLWIKLKFPTIVLSPPPPTDPVTFLMHFNNSQQLLSFEFGIFTLKTRKEWPIYTYFDMILIILHWWKSFHPLKNKSLAKLGSFISRYLAISIYQRCTEWLGVLEVLYE